MDTQYHSTARVDLLDTPVRTGAKRRSTPLKRGAKTPPQNGRYGTLGVFHMYKLGNADFHHFVRNFRVSAPFFMSRINMGDPTLSQRLYDGRLPPPSDSLIGVGIHSTPGGKQLEGEE